MKISNLVFLTLSGILLPMPSLALNNKEVSKDSVQNTKEVTNRNMLLNASSADQPRQINVGLPASLSATIFEDGLPVSYSAWPDMPYFSWFGGTSYGKVSGLSLSEGALQYGAVGYIVDSYHKQSGDHFNGTVNYQLNNYGRQVFDATLTGPIAKGWGYMISSHQIWDPGYAKLQAADLQTRMQNYKVMIDKHFASGRGYASLLYQYCRYINTGSSYAPFIYVGDGSVKKYNGFDYATDAYYGNEASSFSYLDVMDGKVKSKTWKDAGTTDNHQVTFHLNYNFKNGTNLDVSSKAKFGDVSMALNGVSGIVSNAGGYYYANGSAFTGDYIQNRWMMYVPGFERDWLTTAILKGTSKNNRHSWRVGANIWYNRGGNMQMNTVMAHEVKEDPAELYVKNSDGTLTSGVSYNPGSGEYYDGHENKYAVFASDDWTISKRLWMSLGARFEYLGYSGKAALDEGDYDNTRTQGWWIGANKKGGIDRFTGDFINPSVAYNIHYTIAPGFGLLGEYVYVRQRPNLQDYAGEFLPTTAPVNINMGRAGIFWNNSWIQLVSQVSMITQTNYKARTTFYHVMQNNATDGSAYTKGEEVSVTQPITYNVRTVGWTTDFVLSPFKGFTFHGLLTLQDPVYKKFSIFATFPDGVTDGANVSGNTVTAMSKVLVELDPSYSWGKWNVGLNFRYFSKQYINKTNTLYFNGHWESFGHLNYMLNKTVFFSLNVVNFLNETGATGSIGAADLVTDISKYKNYLMSGSYLRPFEVSLSTTINF
ncbi:2,6-beta-D-fructofuranosidase [Prevotella cerevisiae]|uniref:2,6-beta-D-fructofuranosidase n=1 Tax=Segatella cerevisiae TaxID=2053716 RepID=A0ABT1BY75_9BACT|nr:2,6-beta-D-fructofuranosidase [Segatella cerevisiae]MCO6025750.1 2,6-beta-D-fructofuranosidase [Segatella cerevisiae]